MRRAPPTQADAMRLLDRLFALSPIDNKLIAAVEKVISPLCKHIGFRTDLALHTVLEGTELQVSRKEKVNPLKFWHLVECVNHKSEMNRNGNGRNGHAN